MIVLRTKSFAAIQRSAAEKKLRQELAKNLLDYRARINGAAQAQTEKIKARLKNGGTYKTYQEGLSAVKKARSSALGSALAGASSVKRQVERNGVETADKVRKLAFPKKGIFHKNYPVEDFKRSYRRNGPADLTIWDRLMGEN